MCVCLYKEDVYIYKIAELECYTETFWETLKLSEVKAEKKKNPKVNAKL